MALVWLVAAVIALSVGAEARELNTDRTQIDTDQLLPQVAGCSNPPRPVLGPDCVTRVPQDDFKVPVNLTRTTVEALTESENFRSLCPSDGQFFPNGCTSRQRVAIIVPFSHREDQLAIFLRHLHPFLQAQNLHYGIFVVEPAENNGKFNKARLMNVGALESLKIGKFSCFIFHDVDLLPEDRRNLYTCPEEDPRHLSVQVDSLQYKLPYPDLFGGVVAMSVEDFEKVNGYSNRFFGWGGEDDEMSIRIFKNGMKISRYENPIGRYTMIPHNHFNWLREDNRDRYLNESTTEQSADGLNQMKYRIVKHEMKPLYTHIVVDFNGLMKNERHTIEDLRRQRFAFLFHQLIASLFNEQYTTRRVSYEEESSTNEFGERTMDDSKLSDRSSAYSDLSRYQKDVFEQFTQNFTDTILRESPDLINSDDMDAVVRSVDVTKSWREFIQLNGSEEDREQSISVEAVRLMLMNLDLPRDDSARTSNFETHRRYNDG